MPQMVFDISSREELTAGRRPREGCDAVAVAVALVMLLSSALSELRVYFYNLPTPALLLFYSFFLSFSRTWLRWRPRSKLVRRRRRTPCRRRSALSLVIRSRFAILFRRCARRDWASKSSDCTPGVLCLQGVFPHFFFGVYKLGFCCPTRRRWVTTQHIFRAVAVSIMGGPVSDLFLRAGNKSGPRTLAKVGERCLARPGRGHPVF